MVKTINPISDIYTGDEYTFTVAPKQDGELIATDSTVQACIVDRIDSSVATKITNTITLTYDADKLAWVGTFSDVETLKLLVDPLNKQSKIQYSAVFLEVQAAGRTAHIALSVGRGNL